MLHQQPYPTRASGDNAGTTEPTLVAQGNFLSCDYWFQEAQSRDSRRIARVDRAVGEQRSLLGKDGYIVQVAAAVDVALICLACMVIDSCEREEPVNGSSWDSVNTGRDSTVDSSRADDRWRQSLDTVPIQLPGDGKGKGVTLDNGNATSSKVPPLWLKGKTPRD